MLVLNSGLGLAMVGIGMDMWLGNWSGLGLGYYPSH